MDGITQSIVDMGASMQQTNMAVQLNTSVLKKAMETEATAAQALFNSFAETAQAFPGDVGYMFDARA